jgi:hypothetical protein
MGFFKSIAKAFKKATSWVGDRFENTLKLVTGQIGPAAAIGNVASALGLVSPVAAVQGMAKQGEAERGELEGVRNESLLTSKNYDQSRVMDENTVRRGLRTSPGQYPGSGTKNVMLSGSEQEQDMLGEMERRRGQGTLLGG